MEEHTMASQWWTGDPQTDPWEWRIFLAADDSYAYKFDPQPEEAMVIREIFEEAAADVDITEITFWLNDCGFQTVRGDSFTSGTVRSILSNPVYRGDVL